MRAIVIPDIDGFYGEPAEFDPTLEVELHVVDHAELHVAGGTLPIAADIALPIAAGMAVPVTAGADADLEDAWFAFDDTQPVEAAFDDMPTSPWQRIGDWLRTLKRAA